MQKLEVSQFDALFSKRLELYTGDRNLVREDESEQEQLLARLKQCAAAFTTANTAEDSSHKAREAALKKLGHAYDVYKELISHLDHGRKFYNDLATIVATFRTKCQDFSYRRREEAAQMEA